MGFVVISVSAFFASILTFFSGFGLGTILTPVFAIWFPIDLAIALTAIVHLLNNLFKFVLMGKHTNIRIVLKFGIPAVLAAIAGALLLVEVSDLPPLASYSMFGKELEVLPIKLAVALLVIGFTFFELHPKLKNWKVQENYLPLGGLLSGFFGGLSGHQGALRSAFLAKAKLSKEDFIATGVAVACMIDLVRLGIYSRHFSHSGISENAGLLVSASLFAFAGAYLGSKLLKKVTMDVVQKIVAGGLIVLAFALGMGVI